MLNQISLEIDERTEDAIEKLKNIFGVKSRSAAIRRAIAFARVASDAADEHHIVTFLKDGEKQSIILNS